MSEEKDRDGERKTERDGEWMTEMAIDRRRLKEGYRNWENERDRERDGKSQNEGES